MNALPTLGSGFGPALVASLRLIGFLSLIALTIPVYFVYDVLRPSDLFGVTRTFHRLLVKILGIEVRVHGKMATQLPVLFAVNHCSYLDIPILGSVIPAAFVAKAEVASWPLFGFMAKMQKTVFIERRAVRTRAQTESMHDRLAKGQNLILFPEGTSSDGLNVLPFRSSLFAALQDKSEKTPSAMVQPVSIVCTEIDGLPITRAWRPYYSWFGDMTLPGHLWNVFKAGRFTVDIVFHAPVSAAAFPDRKALALYCQRQVADGVQRCLNGGRINADNRIAGPGPALTEPSKG